MDRNLLTGFLIRAVLWGLTYYYIRRGWNPEITDLKKYRLDAYYGSLASFISLLSYWYIDNYII